jgi:hypothetical protein
MICQICFKQPASQRHHRFANKKKARLRYGGNLMDADFNILMACADCHTGHAKIERKHKYNEHQFRQVAKENGYSLPDKMKSCKREDL